MKKEDILSIFIDTEPTLRSPYGIHNYPPMWPILELEGKTLYARPARAQCPVEGDVEGVGYQWHDGHNWAGQGYSAPVEYFLNAVVNEVLKKGATLLRGPCSEAQREVDLETGRDLEGPGG